MVSRNIVVQGRTPFKIIGVTSSDPRFQCQPSGDEKATHILSVTFQADPTERAEEKIRAKLRIDTDQKGVNSVEADVSVQIVPGAG